MELSLRVEAPSSSSDAANDGIVVSQETPTPSWKESDRYYLVYILFCIQGAGALLPYNAYVNCPDYFIHLFGPRIMTLLTSVFMSFDLVGLIFMSFFGSRLPDLVVLVIPYLYFIASLIAIPLLGWLGIHASLARILVLAIAAITGVSTAFLQGRVFGFSYSFPTERMAQAAMVGNGIVGIGVSLVRILTKATIGSAHEIDTFEADRNSATVYFGVSALFMVVSFVSYYLFFVVPFSREILMSEEDSRCSVFGCCSRRSKKKMKRKGDIELFGEDDRLLIDGTGESGNRRIDVDEKEDFEKLSFWSNVILDLRLFYVALLHNLFPHTLSLFFTFLVSLSIFPGLSSIIPSAFPNTWAETWLPVLLSTSFTLFDWIGRQMPSVFRLNISSKVLFCWVMGRFVFIVLFFLCLHPVWWFWHDGYPGILMAALAVSNGYSATVAMMDGSANSKGGNEGVSRAVGRLVQWEKERYRKEGKTGMSSSSSIGEEERQNEWKRRFEETCGIISTTSMVAGISSGAWLSLALYEIHMAVSG